MASNKKEWAVISRTVWIHHVKIAVLHGALEMVHQTETLKYIVCTNLEWEAGRRVGGSTKGSGKVCHEAHYRYSIQNVDFWRPKWLLFVMCWVNSLCHMATCFTPNIHFGESGNNNTNHLFRKPK